LQLCYWINYFAYYFIIVHFIKCLDELQTSLNNAESKIKLIDSKIHESNIFEKKCREQIDSLLQNESDLKVKLESLKEENDALKLNSNKYRIKL